MEKTKTILFIANNLTALRGMLYLIEQLNKYKSVKIVLVCDSCRHYSDEYDVINVGDDGTQRNNDASTTLEKQEWFNTNNVTWRHQFFVFTETLRIMNKHDKESKQILKKVKPDALVIYCDRMKGILQGFLHNAGTIPIIKIPIATSLTDGFAGRYYDKELVVEQKIFSPNFILSKLNPGWVKNINGEKRLFYNAGYIFAGYIKGMVSKELWVSGAGKTTVALVSTQKEKDAILERNKKNVWVTGLLEDYHIAEEKNNRENIKKNLREKYKIDQETIFIFSIPQLAEHNLVSWETHIFNIEFLTDVLTKEFGHILLSLHPKSKKESYIYLEKYNVTFLEEPLREVVGGADYLAAVSTSSVLRWADIVGCYKISILYEIMLKKVEKERMTSYIDLKKEKVVIADKIQNVPDVQNVLKIIMEIV